jgi:hypothetical protein
MPSSAIAGCIQSSTTARQAIHLLIFFIFHQWERTFFPVLPTFGLFLKTDNKNSILSIGSDNGRQIDPDKIVQFLSPHQNERGVDLSKAYSAFFRTAAESAAGIVRINAATLTS